MDNPNIFRCKGCAVTNQPDDHIFQCVGCDEYFCDSCHQSTGRNLTEEEDEDNPSWWCHECTRSRE